MTADAADLDPPNRGVSVRLLVSGGAGYIGSVVAERLASGEP